ncbi:hypothetical protein QFZ31_006740 [Neobacillus niacini]|nr:hypothetical protein [Neobacillus niacini]
MFLKSRTESDLIKLLRILNTRMGLTDEELKQYYIRRRDMKGKWRLTC